MLRRLLLILVVAAMAGCVSGGGKVGQGSDADPAAPSIRPLDGAVGRIVRVHAPLRFVVVDYSLNRPPQPDQRLVVYRSGERVAEVKAGHFQREATVAADILSGEPQVGDEVRAE